jgi:hypothetical protein
VVDAVLRSTARRCEHAGDDALKVCAALEIEAQRDERRRWRVTTADVKERGAAVLVTVLFLVIVVSFVRGLSDCRSVEGVPLGDVMREIVSGFRDTWAESDGKDQREHSHSHSGSRNGWDGQFQPAKQECVVGANVGAQIDEELQAHSPVAAGRRHGSAVSIVGIRGAERATLARKLDAAPLATLSDACGEGTAQDEPTLRRTCE